jgi:hypothetical protein
MSKLRSKIYNYASNPAHRADGAQPSNGFMKAVQIVTKRAPHAHAHRTPQ